MIENNPEKDISVIGGSHSAFSVAFMLIEGPNFYDEDELEYESEYS